MNHAHGQVQAPPLDDDPDEYSRIPWVDTDPRRAPLRNDVISALQVGLSPSVFFFIFFTGYYPLRGAVAATLVMVAIATFVAFAFKWARMASARRRGATIRSPRRKLWVAAVVAIVIGVATVFTSGDFYTDRVTQLLLALAAGLSAAVILLVLESYAVSVPALPKPLGAQRVLQSIDNEQPWD
jgi:hypothetical protein